MAKHYLWTPSGGRLQSIATCGKKNLHWLFLPGGPGLGSEVLNPLTEILTLPGTVWHFDLPADGSNLPAHHPILSPKISIQNWKPAIIEAVTSFENVILVGHSRGGMFALAIPELEKLLKGLVILDAAPDKAWQKDFALKVRKFPNPEAEKFEKAYSNNPSNESLKDFILAATPYMFRKESLVKGIKSLKNLPYNYEAIQWAQKHFDPTYNTSWVPKEISTLILAGADDLATPLHLFTRKMEYHRPNILLREIPHAGHFPWIEEPQAVINAFNEYCDRLRD